MIKSILNKTFKKAMFSIACFLLSSSFLMAQDKENTGFIKAMNHYSIKEYTEALSILNNLKSDEVLDIYIDYYKVLSNYHLWLQDTSSTDLLKIARTSAESYIFKHNDNNIDDYENVVNALNGLKRRSMKVVIISDTTFIPTNPKYEEALKYVTALELYQNIEYQQAYEGFKSIKRGRSIDSQVDYYQLMSLNYLHQSDLNSKSIKAELQKSSSDFISNYNQESKYHNQEVFNKVSNIHKSVTPKPKNQPYFNIGYEGGLIAPFGVRLEYMSKIRLGIFGNVRSSLSNTKDIQSGKVVENKTEFIVGPSVRIANELSLNLGFGMGSFKSPFRNDYASVLTVNKESYFAAYGGATLKLGIVGVVVGASFIDVLERFYKPEPTFGVTIQVK